MSSRLAEKLWVEEFTQIRQRNSVTKNKKKEITVDNIKIEVLPKGDSARYLGQRITFEQQETE